MMPEILPYPGALLALDIGTVRIGLAVSDGLQISPNPLPFLSVKGMADEGIVREVGKWVSARGIVGLVIGLPLSLNGDKNDHARRIESLAGKMAQSVGLPVALVDERFTSHEAESLIREKGYHWRRKKELVDSIAAYLILESYLMQRSQRV